MYKKGVALLLALFTLILVPLLLIAFLELTTTDLQITDNHLMRNFTLYIADAGVEYAISQLKNNKNWQATSETREFPVGSGHTYSVTYPINSGRIASIGTLNSGQQVQLEVKVSVVVGISAPFNVKIIYWREL